MTLTEEQRPTAGFDLEKARDVEKAMSPMPWIVLEEAHGEMIIIRNPNHPMYIDGIVAWGRVAEANTPDAIGIAYMRENFSNLIGEIERLRASLVEHEEHENQTHEVLGNILGTDDTLENVAKRAAARIKELEADNQNLVTMNKALMKNDWILRDNNRKYRKRSQKAELLNKSLKSKIGPDAKPRSWQITDERKATLSASLKVLERLKKNNTDTDHSYLDRGITVLRDMLEEAE